MESFSWIQCYLLRKQKAKLSRYFHKNIRPIHVWRGDSRWQPKSGYSIRERDTDPQKSVKWFVYVSFLRLKCFGVKKFIQTMLLWRETFPKIVYPINGCSASHQASFYGHYFFKCPPFYDLYFFFKEKVDQVIKAQSPCSGKHFVLWVYSYAAFRNNMISSQI